MKVWLVFDVGKELVGVFDSEEKANGFTGNFDRISRIWLDIEEWEVQ